MKLFTKQLFAFGLIIMMTISNICAQNEENRIQRFKNWSYNKINTACKFIYKHRKPIIIGTGTLMAAGLGAYCYFNSSNITDEQKLANDTDKTNDASTSQKESAESVELNMLEKLKEDLQISLEGKNPQELEALLQHRNDAEQYVTEQIEVLNKNNKLSQDELNQFNRTLELIGGQKDIIKYHLEQGKVQPQVLPANQKQSTIVESPELKENKDKKITQNDSNNSTQEETKSDKSVTPTEIKKDDLKDQTTSSPGDQQPQEPIVTPSNSDSSDDNKKPENNDPQNQENVVKNKTNQSDAMVKTTEEPAINNGPANDTTPQKIKGEGDDIAGKKQQEQQP